MQISVVGPSEALGVEVEVDGRLGVLDGECVSCDWAQ